MATPCRVAFFVCADATPPREQGGGGRDNHQTYPRKGEGDLTPPRDRTTALNTTPRPHNSTCQQPANFAAAQKMLRKMLQFQENFLLLFTESK